jgi:hypothetical protein
MTRTPKAPADLGAAGRGLWRSVHRDALLRDDEIRVLLDACHAADEIDLMTTALAGQPVMVEGAAGQPRAHPLLAEIRAHRLMLARLLSQLAVPDPADDQARDDARTRNARKAARARWDRP